MKKMYAVTLEVRDGKLTDDYQLFAFSSVEERDAYVKGVQDTLDRIAYLNLPDTLFGWHAIYKYEDLILVASFELLNKINKEIGDE